MKQIVIYLALLFFCLILGSCKSSQQISKQKNPVSISDFRSLGKSIEGDSRAVKLSEVVDVSEGGLTNAPWASYMRYWYDVYSQRAQWITVVEDKIRFIADNVNGEPFGAVFYFNPPGMRWDLMTRCEMRLYTLDENGKITNRRIKRKEIVHERINDSICKMRLNIHENVAGKILVRQYTLASPYYTIQSVHSALTPPLTWSPDLDLQKMEPWIFQKDIPLLYGKYEIRLPEDRDEYDHFIISKVVKLGNGEVNVQSNEVGDIYSVTKVTATVSNVLPLPKGSNEQPLGIQIIREWDDKLLEETGNR